jgi:L-lactate dehydrogenase complex protein LldG
MNRNVNGEDKVTRFQAQVTSLGGYFATVPNMLAIREYVTRVASTSSARQIALSSGVSKEKLFSSEPVSFEIATQSEMSREAFFAALKTAKIGVSTVDLGVAETGTLIVATSDESDRLVTALPEIHIAFLPYSRLVSSLRDAEPQISQLLKQGHSVVVSLISASSRTLDIGGLLVLGVHGPKELHVLLLEQEISGGA